MNEQKDMHHASCLEVGMLLEKRAAEEPLTPAEQELLEAHVKTCPDCGDFVKILFGLSAFADTPATEAAAMEATWAANRYFSSRRRTRTIAAVASIGAMAAAALFVLLRPSDPASSPPTFADENCAPSKPVALTAGVWMSHCNDTAVHTATQAEGTLRVSIKDGAVGLAVDPNRQNKHPVIVSTPFGEVWVKGTVLTVHVDADDARVEVFRGLVKVHPANSQAGAFEVSEGNAARLSKPPAFELKHPRGEALRKRLEQFEAPAPLQSELAPSDATEANHSDSDTGSMVGDTDTTGTSLSNANAPRGKVRREPLDILIQDAQSCLIAMDWTCAAAKYRQIIRDYPNSQESQSALVSLAKIELRRLGHPDKALRYFTAYRTRSPKGPLAEEAFWGTAEAHRRLGNKKAEADALRQFVGQFPHSTSISKAKVRLQDIE